MKKVLVLNGPNINMLGKRQPEVYGYETLADIEQNCVNVGADLSLDVTCKQSNYEGELITWIQEAREEFDAIVMNPAATATLQSDHGRTPCIRRCGDRGAYFEHPQT